MTSRRKFIRQSILGTAGSLLFPGFLKAYEIQNIRAIDQQKKVVIIQLSGGNDGLNTIVPYRNDLYYKARPTIAVNSGKVLQASSELGFNPALQSLRMLYDEGYLAVINNVGYPNPDRSHFRSMDIWQSASGADQYLETGWIGRYLDSSCGSCASHRALEADDTLSLALKGERIKGIAVRDVNKLYKAVQRESFRNAMRQVDYDALKEPSIHYLYKTMAETASSAEYLHDQTQTSSSRSEYPAGQFSSKLKSIAGLIHARVDTRVYYASLSGFDTHANQVNQHERLLHMYSEGLHAFVKDLGHELMKDVLILTFSEFGRRVQQNASGGTDHGTANNVFIVSGSLRRKGFINDTPDLSRLDEGDLIHRIDFRSVYASILDKWLEVPSERILNKSFTPVDFI